MTKQLFIAAAAFLILAPAAFAQPGGPAAGGITAAGGAAGPADPSITAQINATLQAAHITPTGQSAGSDATTVGGASVERGLRMPNPSTGTYGGLSGPSYGAPGATPYTGAAGSTSGSTGRVYAPGSVPYTGPAAAPGATAPAP